MDSRKLRHLVTLEQSVQTADGGVSTIRTFEPVEDVWAEIKATRDTRYLASVQLDERETHQITIRWRARTDFSHVSTEDGRRWRVRGVTDPDGRRRELRIAAEELTPEVEA